MNNKGVKPDAKHSAKSPEITSIAKTRAEALKRRQEIADKINRENLEKMKKRRVVAAPVKTTTNLSPASKKSIPDPKRASLKTTKSEEKKDKAVESAMKTLATMEKKEKKTPKMKNKSFFSIKRVLLAFGCAALAVAGIAYLVNLSMPDISARVAAVQTGIDASTPYYIPRDYSLSSIVSEEGKIAMAFSAGEGKDFSLTQEKSSWDVSALENNYVKEEFVDYTTIRENGLTLFISSSNCAWVNGGKLFVIEDQGANLTKKQIQSIASSLQ